MLDDNEWLVGCFRQVYLGHLLCSTCSQQRVRERFADGPLLGRGGAVVQRACLGHTGVPLCRRVALDVLVLNNAWAGRRVRYGRVLVAKHDRLVILVRWWLVGVGHMVEGMVLCMVFSGYIFLLLTFPRRVHNYFK